MNRFLLQNFREESCVHGLALGIVTALTVHWHAIYHVEVLLKRSVHKCNTIFTEFVVERDMLRRTLVPFNLITANAVSADLTDALPSASSEEPNSTDFLIEILCLNWHVEVKPVRDFIAEVLELVIDLGVELI